MIVVDVETTGTNPWKNSILSIGAIEMDEESRQFYDECRIWDGAHINDEALAINGYTHDQIMDSTKKSEGELVKNFLSWYMKGKERTLVGVNPGLDHYFLMEAASRGHIDFPIAKRTIDLHTVVFMHMIKRGLQPPEEKHHHSAINSSFITTYVGIPEENKIHNALNGALWEAEALSRLFYDKGLLTQFKEFPIPWLKSLRNNP